MFRNIGHTFGNDLHRGYSSLRGTEHDHKIHVNGLMVISLISKPVSLLYLPFQIIFYYFEF